jgi:ABC-2 type transport system permease protein
MLLAGILLPIALGPLWLRGLAHIDPLYYATQAARSLCSGVMDANALTGFAVLLGLLAAALLWATGVFRRAVA